LEKIFNKFTGKLEEKGIITRSGSIVDATFVVYQAKEIPKQRMLK